MKLNASNFAFHLKLRVWKNIVIGSNARTMAGYSRKAVRHFINRLDDSDPDSITTDLIKRHCIDVLNRVFSNQGTTPDDCEGGLYVGVGGVAYMCYHVSQCSAFSKEKQMLLTKAKEYVEVAVNYVENSLRRSAKIDAGFLLGNSGIWAIAALLYHASGRDDMAEHFLRHFNQVAAKIMPLSFSPHGSDELLVGRAGYLCGALYLNKQFGRQVVPTSVLHQLCKVTLESGRNYVRMCHHSRTPLMYAYYGTEYLGAAHGLSGILQMLLSVDDYLDQNPDDEQDIKKAVDFLLKLQQQDGNFPCAMDELDAPRTPEFELVHWCHGASGVVYLMAKAYLRWKDKAYLDACFKCGELVWEKGLLRKGPGICHGVSGSGYVFLLLYRLTNDVQHLNRALQFANFMFSEEFKQARTPDCPYSLYEGLAGTACFLSDLLQPKKAHFPFFDVF